MLETKIEELTKAVIALTELIGKIEAGKSNEVDLMAESRAQIVRDLEKQDKAVMIAVEKQIAAEAAPVMPAAPTFEPVVEAVLADCPITDGKSLIDFVMTIYKELGAERGAGIQNVLVEMGLTNVNEVRPTEYVTFYEKVMALKG